MTESNSWVFSESVNSTALGPASNVYAALTRPEMSLYLVTN